MIEVEGLTKTYRATRAVDDLSFHVRPGIVTGFLGPNGAGKSTTMRMILGLDRPNSGTATINGVPYNKLSNPLHTVGALLDAKAVHPNRSARNHLRWIAHSAGIPTSRVDEVLALVGLEEVAKKRVGGFSLGMGQRLGLAQALLGDPEVLMLDEPVNGLDPEGILWVRNFLKTLASEGRTILLKTVRTPRWLFAPANPSTSNHWPAPLKKSNSASPAAKMRKAGTPSWSTAAAAKTSADSPSPWASP